MGGFCPNGVGVKVFRDYFPMDRGENKKNIWNHHLENPREMDA